MFENTDFTGYDTNPDVVGYADIHYAFKAFYGERMLFNVGSVGNPLDRTLACYVLLTGEYEGDGATALSADIIRLPYDIDESLRRAAESGMPEYDLYEMELRSARYRGSPPASPAAH
jgi:diadenosine tetraphosphatase ApaH/serine/threonine PP2A family protein phosphatase